MRKTTIKALAAMVDGSIQGDEEQIISGISNIASAKAGDITFLNNEKYISHLESTQASAVLLKEQDIKPSAATLIITKDPYLAYAKIATHLTTPEQTPRGIHPSAVIEDGAEVHASAYVGANTVIESNAQVGENVHVSANCFIGRSVKIGRDSLLHANVSVYANTILGERAIIHCGAVLGSDGFGFANEAGAWVKIPQIGKLVIGNDVEIGANTAIDRGAIDDTIIHDGVKIDNLVHIAHNIEIGDHSAIAGCVGMAGSTKIGKHCTVAGKAAITGHIELADNVHIGGMAMVTKSLEAGQYSSGIPAEPVRNWRRNVARFRQMDKMEKRIKELEKKVESLKGS